MRQILAKVVWNFDLELCAESEDWSDQKIMGMWRKPPLNVKLTAAVRDEKQVAI